MIYGYARVSSKSQLDGNGLEVQLNELTNEYVNIQIYEEQYTGTKVFERPVLNELLSKLEAGDKLVATNAEQAKQIEALKQLNAQNNAQISELTNNVNELTKDITKVNKE